MSSANTPELGLRRGARSPVRRSLLGEAIVELSGARSELYERGWRAGHAAGASVERERTAALRATAQRLVDAVGRQELTQPLLDQLRAALAPSDVAMEGKHADA